jgi:hypothetical protein
MKRKILNSCAVIAIGCPSRTRRMLLKSTTTSPKQRTSPAAAGCRVERRMAPRTRASNSRGLNGLVT